MPGENAQEEGTDAPSFKTELAFYIWLAVLLGDLSTLGLGLLGHIVTILAAPLLSIKTQAAIHAAIPVLLTAVKLVTVPLLVFLTPFARHHSTFKSWMAWAKVTFVRARRLGRFPRKLVTALYTRFSR